MPLPSPLPDDPRKWDGWRNFSSANPYAVLGFEPGENPDAEAIEAAYRELVLWWQKKLPLRSQPANPLSQLLRPGLDEAPQRLAVAKAELMDPARRLAADAVIAEQQRIHATTEFARYVDFSIHGGRLSRLDHDRLREYGVRLGLDAAGCAAVIEERLDAAGATLDEIPAAVAPSSIPAAPAPATPHADAASEYLRMLALAKVDELRIGPEQKEALLNLGMSLGLDEMVAEELLDQAAYGAAAMTSKLAPPARPQAAPVPTSAAVPRATPPIRPPASSTPSPAPLPARTAPLVNFRSGIGIEMVALEGGEFRMGSDDPSAPPHERPVTRVRLRPFYISKFPVTNAEYEQFDPDHFGRRLPSANGSHPVVLVTYAQAQAFCRWLSSREGKRYRLPTEAEWEFTAKGGDSRPYPWGSTSPRGDLANFADLSSRLKWGDTSVDDGYAQTSPVGSYPRGASPFGVLDLAGNVWEWCVDGYGTYPGGTQADPQGVRGAPKRVMRGGSWRSRFSSLTTTCRGFNPPDSFASDTGFRIVCEA
jgi:formylglycine-generating enzyme required for sulfatase activity